MSPQSCRNPRSFRNLLLRQLSQDEWSGLSGYFEEQTLAFKQTVIEQNKPADHVYFPETGVLSLVATMDNGDWVETGVVGNEGFAGISTLLGAWRSPGRVFCQVPGKVIRLPSHVLERERARGGPWVITLLRYAHFVHAMAAQSAACNRLHPLSARLSRWLLMTHDRVHRDRFPMTEDLLARMLGVPAADIAKAGASLEQMGLIAFSRGWLTIENRAGLEGLTCECYSRIARELHANVYAPGATGTGE